MKIVTTQIIVVFYLKRGCIFKQKQNDEIFLFFVYCVSIFDIWVTIDNVDIIV